MKETYTNSEYEDFALHLVHEGRIRVDKDGTIWRLWDGRNNVRHFLKTPRPIIPKLRHGSQYLEIALACYGRDVKIRVHRLVWMAFNGPIPQWLQVNHKDGIKTHNALENLELVTNAGNIKHAFGLGLIHSARGQTSSRSKLNSEQVAEIRWLSSIERLSLRQLAARYKVSYHSIWMIVTNRTWTHIDDAEAPNG